MVYLLNLFEKTRRRGRGRSRFAFSFISRFVFAVDFFLVFSLGFLCLNVILHLCIRHLTCFPFIWAFAGHMPCTLTIVTFNWGSFSPVWPVNIHCVGILLSRRISLIGSSTLRAQLECSWLPGTCVPAIILSRLVRLWLFGFVGFFFSCRSVCLVIEGFFFLIQQLIYCRILVHVRWQSRYYVSNKRKEWKFGRIDRNPLRPGLRRTQRRLRAPALQSAGNPSLHPTQG